MATRKNHSDSGEGGNPRDLAEGAFEALLYDLRAKYKLDEETKRKLAALSDALSDVLDAGEPPPPPAPTGLERHHQRNAEGASRTRSQPGRHDGKRTPAGWSFRGGALSENREPELVRGQATAAWRIFSVVGSRILGLQQAELEALANRSSPEAEPEQLASRLADYGAWLQSTTAALDVHVGTAAKVGAKVVIRERWEYLLEGLLEADVIWRHEERLRLEEGLPPRTQPSDSLGEMSHVQVTVRYVGSEPKRVTVPAGPVIAPGPMTASQIHGFIAAQTDVPKWLTPQVIGTLQAKAGIRSGGKSGALSPRSLVNKLASLKKSKLRQ